PGSAYVLPPSDGVTFNLYQGSGTKTILYTILNPDRPSSQFQLCFASTLQFATPSGPAGFDTASGYYIGLLPACKTAPAPCFQGNSQDPHTKAVTLTALVPT